MPISSSSLCPRLDYGRTLRAFQAAVPRTPRKCLTPVRIYGNFCHDRNEEIAMTTLTPVMRKFVLHWGEMGTRWGVNRTVAQVHALLYLSPEPLNAEEIAKALSVARSNVSTSLRELESWGIIRAVHRLGDR